MKNDIYRMDLHESFEVQSAYANMLIVKVAGGWIYHISRLDCNQMNTVFVPFDNEFMQTYKEKQND